MASAWHVVHFIVFSYPRYRGPTREILCYIIYITEWGFLTAYWCRAAFWIRLIAPCNLCPRPIVSGNTSAYSGLPRWVVYSLEISLSSWLTACIAEWIFPKLFVLLSLFRFAWPPKIAIDFDQKIRREQFLGLPSEMASICVREDTCPHIRFFITGPGPWWTSRFSFHCMLLLYNSSGGVLCIMYKDVDEDDCR